MRIIVLGAGAIGGHHGLHLADADGDVTFLVRERRAAQLARDGLMVASHGQENCRPAPPIEAGQIEAPVDLILLTRKAYDLDTAYDAITPPVGSDTVVLPPLNELAHFDALDARLGTGRVPGGADFIAASLTPDWTIHHTGPSDCILFGLRAGAAPRQVEALASLFAAPLLTAARCSLQV